MALLRGDIIWYGWLEHATGLRYGDWCPRRPAELRPL